MLSERVITQFNNRNRNNRYNNNSIPRQNHTQYQCIPLDASLCMSAFSNRFHKNE